MDLERSLSEAWNRLTDEEKLVMSIYKMRLENNAKIDQLRNLILYTNEIHEKYPSFTMLAVP